MRSLIGLIWALVGGAVGFIVGALAATVYASVTHMSNREGNAGYFMIFIGLIGAVIGVIAGLLLYGRTAPSGQAAEYTGLGTLGLVGLFAAIAIALWAFMQLREKPLEYNGAMASLQMEIRIRNADIPDTNSGSWLNIEVQTAKTRPVADVSWRRRRKDGDYTIIPASQGPLQRSASRVLVVQIEGHQVEVFTPPMKRTPDSKAGWSQWYHPQAVDPPYGVVPTTPPKPMLELRYRVRSYGDEKRE